MTHVVDPRLKEFASEKQVRWIDAVNLHGSFRKAARAENTHHDRIRKSLRSLQRQLALQGFAPANDMTHMAPEPFVVKGVSTYYDAGGVPRAQWVKTRLSDDAFLNAIKEGVESFLADVPEIVPASAPTDVDTDIIPWIQIGDAHLGMLAHESETGENFDLKIAERELLTAFYMLIDELGSHERIVINDLGDFTHYENFSATTEAGGHSLDFDSRFPKMIHVYSRLMRALVEKALEKAKFVDVIINQGNHSRTNDIWMAELLRVAFGHTGRVNVLNNDSVFIGYRMGNTFVMVHHSDKCRPQHLTGVMITDFRKDFGETEYHYIDIGHIHHNMVSKEYPSVQIESWNQLAAGDKYAHDNGYRSRQSISVVFRSRTYGEVLRKILPIRRVRDLIDAASKGSIKRPQPKIAFTA